MPSKEIYFSVDIETDGSIPGPYSMRSVGICVSTETEFCVDTFYAVLQPLPHSTVEPDVLAWWRSTPENQEQWAKLQVNQEPAEAAMHRLADWIQMVGEKHKRLPVCVASPSGYDYTFLYWYLIRFLGKSPFQHRCLDIRSYTMPLFGRGYLQSGKETLPKIFFSPDLPHTHNALDDAKEQGWLFFQLMQYSRRIRELLKDISVPSLGN